MGTPGDPRESLFEYHTTKSLPSLPPSLPPSLIPYRSGEQPTSAFEPSLKSKGQRAAHALPRI